MPFSGQKGPCPEAPSDSELQGGPNSGTAGAAADVARLPRLSRDAARTLRPLKLAENRRQRAHGRTRCTSVLQETRIRTTTRWPHATVRSGDVRNRDNSKPRGGEGAAGTLARTHGSWGSERVWAALGDGARASHGAEHRLPTRPSCVLLGVCFPRGAGNVRPHGNLRADVRGSFTDSRRSPEAARTPFRRC